MFPDISDLQQKGISVTKPVDKHDGFVRNQLNEALVDTPWDTLRTIV